MLGRFGGSWLDRLSVVKAPGWLGSGDVCVQRTFGSGTAALASTWLGAVGLGGRVLTRRNVAGCRGWVARRPAIRSRWPRGANAKPPRNATGNRRRG